MIAYLVFNFESADDSNRAIRETHTDLQSAIQAASDFCKSRPNALSRVYQVKQLAPGVKDLTLKASFESKEIN